VEKFTCKNCGKEFEGNYSWNCGEVKTGRIKGKDLLTKILDSFDLKWGFFYNLKAITTNPGSAIRLYLEGQRKPFQNPFKYALIIIGLDIFLTFVFGSGLPFWAYFYFIGVLISYSIVLWLLHYRSINFSESLIYTVFLYSTLNFYPIILRTLFEVLDIENILFILFGIAFISYSIWSAKVFFKEKLIIILAKQSLIMSFLLFVFASLTKLKTVLFDYVN